MLQPSPRILGIIPARYSSTRLPGKPLRLIAGKSLIQRTYENAARCRKLEALVVATDDQRIYDHVSSFGGRAVMTAPECPTGTDRLVHALNLKAEWLNTALVVNIQGDEPCLEPVVIENIIESLEASPQAVMATPIAKIHEKNEALDPSVVKCVIDQNHFALYFSRGLVPYGKKGEFSQNITYYRHIGLYVYRKEFLMRFSSLAPTPLQLAEDLEQLKVLESGYRIKTAVVESQSIGVDTPEDLQKVERLLCKQNTSS